MNMVTKEMLANYQIRRGETKDAFIDFVCKKIPGFKIDEAKYICNNKNLIYGNVEDAEVIITAHYDTCANSIYGNVSFPKNRLPFVLLMIFSYILGLIIGHVIGIIGNNVILIITIFVIVYLFLIKPIFGRSNENNYNDNTSGVVAVINLIQDYPELIDKKVAFVLFDNEEYGLLGSRAFKRKYMDTVKNQLIINMDCISDGDYILVICSKQAKEKYSNEINNSFVTDGKKQMIIEDSKKCYYPSDHKIFPIHIGIGSFNKTKRFNLLYLNKIHTNKDIVFDEINIELINKCIVNLINCL